MAGDHLAGSTDGSTARPDVELRLPADGAYVSVLRTATAGLAARLDFTIDDIEDLRIAVGEACAIVLPEAEPGSDLRCWFRLRPERLTFGVGVDTAGPAAPDEDSFAWQVLTTLAESARFETTPESLQVTIAVRSSLVGDDA